MSYYAIVNDIIGGYAVAMRDAPMSEQSFEAGDVVVADMTDRHWAERIAEGLQMLEDKELNE